MNLLKLILLAIIQGIAEILPISSSGHLILFKHMLNIDIEGLSLEIFLHFGSLIAVIIYYFKDIKKLLVNSLKYIKTRNNEFKSWFNLLICLFISTFITGIFALLFKDYINLYLSNVKCLPIFFILTSLVLYISSIIKTKKSLSQITILDSIKIGLFQIIGIIPGISRSGITIFGCKLSKLDNDSSFRYSFLLFIPITLSSFILDIPSIFSLSLKPHYYLISLIVSILFTLLSLVCLKKLINNKKLHYFSYYLLFISLITLFLTIK